jgi:hypothetical protein
VAAKLLQFKYCASQAVSWFHAYQLFEIHEILMTRLLMELYIFHEEELRMTILSGVVLV